MRDFMRKVGAPAVIVVTTLGLFTLCIKFASNTIARAFAPPASLSCEPGYSLVNIDGTWFCLLRATETLPPR